MMAVEASKNLDKDALGTDAIEGRLVFL